MSTQHTPGPWKTRKGFDEETLEVFRPDKSIKKPFYPTELAVVRSEDKEGKANARLIAAAPDLLEALQFVMSAHGEQLDLAFQQAHEAIAKATGQKGGA